jgi:DNA polymerase-3 subunit delta
MRHFNIILQINELSSKGLSNQIISQKVGVPAFSVARYINQAKNFTIEQLYKSLKLAADTEEQIKTGRINDRIGVELMIIGFSRK